MAGPAKKTGGLDLSVLQDRIGFRVHMLDLHMMRWLGERCARFGLTPASASVLMVIHSNPGVRHGELADALLIRRPNMTKLMRRLETRGLLCRRGSPGDKRRVVLALTPEGEQVIAEVGASFRMQDEVVRQALTGAGDSSLLDLMDSMHAALDAPVETSTPPARKPRRKAAV